MEHLEFDKIHLDIDGEFATITLNDPDNLNALSFDMVTGFCAAFNELGGKGRHIRMLFIRGEGRGFCAGLNLNDRQRAVKQGDPSFMIMNSHFFPMLRHLKEAPFPTVCAVNGPCAGIGVTLALMCDVAVAGRSAYFFLPFTKNLGSVGDAGISWILPRIIGWSRARQMILFGTKVGAQQALDWGMVYEVFDDDALRAKAEAIARELAEGATVAQTVLRRFIWEALENDYDRQLYRELELNGITHQSSDYKAALAARQQGRPVQFEGR